MSDSTFVTCSTFSMAARALAAVPPHTTPRGPVETVIRGESLGLGAGVTRVSGIADMCLLAMDTPVDDENRYLRCMFSVPRSGDSSKAEGWGGPS